MKDAPKELWIDYQPYAEGYAEVSDTENSDTKYIREDECKAREEAAYNRGLEEAAKIADKHLRESKEASSMARPDEVATKVGCWAWGRAAEKIAAAIRAQIQERDDGTHED